MSSIQKAAMRSATIVSARKGRQLGACLGFGFGFGFGFGLGLGRGGRSEPAS
jgi:hypothetical protein